MLITRPLVMRTRPTPVIVSRLDKLRNGTNEVMRIHLTPIIISLLNKLKNGMMLITQPLSP